MKSIFFLVIGSIFAGFVFSVFVYGTAKSNQMCRVYVGGYRIAPQRCAFSDEVMTGIYDVQGNVICSRVQVDCY